MTTEQIQDLIDYLRTIGEAAVEKGFELAMLEVQVSIVQNALFFGLAVIGIVVGLLFTRSALRYKPDPNNRSDDGVFTRGMAAGGALLISTMVFLATAHNLIGLMINPQWRAIEIVLGLLR